MRVRGGIEEVLLLGFLYGYSIAVASYKIPVPAS
jgi:hypothetical protein